MILTAALSLVFIATSVFGMPAADEINIDWIEQMDDAIWPQQKSRKMSMELVSSYVKKILQNEEAVPVSFAVSDICLNDTMRVLSALADGEQWASEMFDAAGKIPSGLLQGQLTSLGSYDECINVEPIIYQGPNRTDPMEPFDTQYCKVTWRNLIEGQNIIMGVCVPNTCPEKEVSQVIKYVLSQIPGDPLKDVKVAAPRCQKNELEYDTRSIIVLSVLGFFVLMMALGTLYDVFVVHKLHQDKYAKWNYKTGGDILANGDAKTSPLSMANGDVKTSYLSVPNGDVKSSHLSMTDNEKAPLLEKESKEPKQGSAEPGRLEQILIAFSLYTNGSKLLSTHQGAGTLTAINGIRFFSMTWVILGHCYTSMISTAANRFPFYVKMVERWTFQAIANATVSVDSFFALSGLLVAYLSLKEMRRVGGAHKFNWIMFYFHRFWRLTPPYMLVLMVWISLFLYMGNGPNWPQTWTEQKNCEETWWRNLLYINNFYEEKKCMGWSWYLANDMQFYVLSPLMLIPLFYSPLLGGVVCLMFLLGTTITPGVLSSVNDWPASTLLAQQGDAEDKLKAKDYQNYYYIRPYCRMGPYIIGIIFGYILYKTNCKVRMNKLVNLCGWAVAIGCCMSVLYGPYDSMNGSPNSTEINALYNAVHRSVWALGVCWVIFACTTGNGGIVNGFLSWKALVPLARLTYCAYLIHIIVQNVYKSSKRDYMHMTDLEVIYRFLGDLTVAYGVAFVVSLAFEAPFMGLEKAIFKRERKA